MSVLHITDKEFDSVISSKDKPVLVDFWAEWCMPCKMFAPVIDKLDAEIGDRAVIAKVNIDECEELASQYRIMSNGSNFQKRRGRTAFCRRKKRGRDKKSAWTVICGSAARFFPSLQYADILRKELDKFRNSIHYKKARP